MEPRKQVGKQKVVSRFVTVYLPVKLVMVVDAAAKDLGFNSRSGFIAYVLRSWLEERGYFIAPRVPLIRLPAEPMRDGEGRSTPGDEPGLKEMVVGGVGP